jgi:hypothetical protein
LKAAFFNLPGEVELRDVDDLEPPGIAPPNGLELMEHYVHAIRKVLVDNLEEVADLAPKAAPPT